MRKTIQPSGNNNASLAMLLVVLSWIQIASAQSVAAKPIYIHPSSVSSSLRQIVEALGDRVYEKGKERVALHGTLDYQGRIAQVTVLKESPGYLRIEFSGDSSKTIVDDLSGLTGSKAIDEGDEELAELFGSDSSDGFLQGMSQGGSLRKIGDCFVVAGVKGFGEQVDIFDLYAPAPARNGKPYVQRQYLFDSASGLLSRVWHSAEQSGQTVPIQVVLSNYQVVSGYKFPGRIVRMAGEKITHTFTLQGGAVAPRLSDNSFRSVR